MMRPFDPNVLRFIIGIHIATVKTGRTRTYKEIFESGNQVADSPWRESRNRISEIEGKAARVAASESGNKRVSIEEMGFSG